jgi:hypothetical protein
MDRTQAEQFCRSYGAATAARDPIALAGHYGFPFVSFTLGAVASFADREEANRSVTQQLDRFVKGGIGLDISLDHCEIVAVSDQSALCHLTWSIRPANGLAPWSWTNVYALRQAADGSMHFEASFADNEIAELLKRIPDFFSL